MKSKVNQASDAGVNLFHQSCVLAAKFGDLDARHRTSEEMGNDLEGTPSCDPQKLDDLCLLHAADTLRDIRRNAGRGAKHLISPRSRRCTGKMTGRQRGDPPRKFHGTEELRVLLKLSEVLRCCHSLIRVIASLRHIPI